MDLLSAEPEWSHVVEDYVSGFGPLEGLAVLVVRVDVLENRGAEWGMLVWEPRLSACSVSSPKKRSTRFGHEE